MNAPITVHPLMEEAEAFLFTGGSDCAHAIALWMQSHMEHDLRTRMFRLEYTASLHSESTFSFRYNDDSYELAPGDWVIREGRLFSICRRADFPYRFATPVQKILAEAGLS